jgi:hypothetical protein
MYIDFTGGAPIKVSASTVQPIELAIDLGGHYRVLDLICSVQSIGGGGTFTAAILTSPQGEIEVPQWPTLGSFAGLSAADTAVRASFVGALRYVRYSIGVSGGIGPAYMLIQGYARTME